jgi:hypothetical protein
MVEPMDSNEQIEAWLAEVLQRHLEAQLRPMIFAINALVVQLVEQVEIREQVNRDYLEQNRELRVEVAKLAANVATLRDATPPAAELVN